MQRVDRLRIPLALVVGFAACSSPSTSPSGSGGSPAGPTAADLAFCVQDVNGYRARTGRTPYAESPALEAFAGTSAREDSTANVPHAHFTGTNGGGVASAENEVLNGAFGSAAHIEDAIRSANALFFSEGPGGGHYEHLVSASLTELGCGVYVADGRITIAEDFR